MALPHLFGVCMYVSPCTAHPLCCGPASLLMTQQSTLMTRNTNSPLFCEPLLIGWPVKHRKLCKKKKTRTIQCQRTVSKKTAEEMLLFLKQVQKAAVLQSLMSAEVGTNKGREQLAKPFVCLSFTSNSSLKPVRGSRSPLIRTNAVFALLSKHCHLVGPLCDLAAHTEKLCWFASFEVYHFHTSIIILRGQLFIQL